MPPPSWVGRVLFRQALAVYLRKDTGPERGPAARGRLNLLAAAWRFARGRGPVPRLNTLLTEGTFEQVDTTSRPLTAEAERLFERYRTLVYRFVYQMMPRRDDAAHHQRHHGGDHNRHDRPFRRDQGRHRDRYNDRGDRDRHGYDRDRHQEVRQPQQDRPSPQDQQGEAGDSRRRERFQQAAHEQPEFLRRPVRRARPENGESDKDEPPRE